MDFEALVRAITERVLTELRAERLSLQTGYEKPRVLVLAAREAALEAKIRERLGDGYSLVFRGEYAEPKAERYIVPRLCCPDMAALAAGQVTGPLTREILNLLLAGRKVEVMDFEYASHAATAPGPLYKLYEGHAKILASYGLVPFEEKGPESVTLRATLITESDVRQAAGRGAGGIVLEAGAIVTPLAADAAKELGIKILKSL